MTQQVTDPLRFWAEHGFLLRGESANPVPDAKICLLAGGSMAPLVSSALFGVDNLQV